MREVIATLAICFGIGSGIFFSALGVVAFIQADERFTLEEAVAVLDKCEADLPRTVHCKLGAFPILDEQDVQTPSGIRK